jgi:hypothetical protein
MTSPNLISKSRKADAASRLGFPLLIAAVIVCIVLAYIRFVSEEIAPFQPLATDQGYYLRAAHEYFDFAKGHGVINLLWAHFRHNTAALGFYTATSLHMALLASLVFPLFGSGRMGALSLLLISWVGLLSVTSFAFRRIGKSWNYAALAVGLLLGTKLCFVGAGGIADFRMDFPAACWTGISFLFWCLSLEESDSKFAWLGSFSTLVLVFFRIITLVYWAPILIGLFVYTAWEYKKRDNDRFLKLLPPLLGLGAASLLIVIWDWSFIYSYYFVAHIGNEASIRKNAIGLLHNLWGTILYFPKSLWNEHLGVFSKVQLTAVLLFISGLYLWKRKTLRNSKNVSGVKPESILLGLALVVWPVVVLTIQPDRAPQVVGIALTPLIATMGLLIIKWTQGISKALPRVFDLLSLMVLVTGFLFWEQKLVRSAPFQEQGRIDAFNYSQILNVIATRTGRAPQVMFLDWVDGFDHNAVTLYAYERLNISKRFEMEVPRFIFEKTQAELLESLYRAEAVIIPKNSEHLKTIPWPIMRSISDHFSSLENRVHSSMVFAREFTYAGYDYELYLAHSAQIVSPFPDWLPPHGGYLQLGSDFPVGGQIELRGPAVQELTGQELCLRQKERNGKKLICQAVSLLNRDKYSVLLTPPLQMTGRKSEFEISFLKSLPPQPNGDTRQLSLRYPNEIIFYPPLN